MADRPSINVNNRVDPEVAARDFIESVIEINRRHGMGSSVPERIYASAISDTKRALKGMSPRRA